jgi:hypothetical protein
VGTGFSEGIVLRKKLDSDDEFNVKPLRHRYLVIVKTLS